MKGLALAAGIVLALDVSAASAEMASAFVPYVAAETCAVVASGGGEGDAGDRESSVCAGSRGFPVLSRFAFGRLFLFFGFPPQGEGPYGRESFGQPHSFGPSIE